MLKQEIDAWIIRNEASQLSTWYCFAEQY